MSRRGRPRKTNPESPSARALASRNKRIAAGGKRIELILDADIAAQLDALAIHFRESRADVISRLLGKASRRVFGTSPSLPPSPAPAQGD